MNILTRFVVFYNKQFKSNLIQFLFEMITLVKKNWEVVLLKFFQSIWCEHDNSSAVENYST